MLVYSFSNAMPLIFRCVLFLNKRYIYTKMRTLQHQHLSWYQHKYWRRSNIYQHQIMERLFFCFLFVDGGRPATLVNFYQSCYIVSQTAYFYFELVFFKKMFADIGWYYAYFSESRHECGFDSFKVYKRTRMAQCSRLVLTYMYSVFNITHRIRLGRKKKKEN